MNIIVKKTPQLGVYIFLCILTLSFLVLRIINLGADPPLSLSWSIGPWLDSNFYLKNVYDKITTGVFVPNKYDDNQLFSNPVYVFLIYLIVKTFGLGYTQLTFLSIISSLITLIILFFWTKYLYDLKTAFWSVSLLGFNYFYLMYNRLVLLETPTIMFIILSLFLFSVSKTYPFFSLLSGLIAICAFFCRTFSIMFLLAIFSSYLFYLVTDKFNIIIFEDALKRRFKNFFTGMFVAIALWFFFFALPNFENIAFHYSSRFHMASGSFFCIKQYLNITHKWWFKILPFFITMPVLTIVFIIFSIFILCNLKTVIKRIKPEEIMIFFYLLLNLIFLLFLYHHIPPRRFLYFIPFLCLYTGLAITKGFWSLEKYTLLRKLKNVSIIALLIIHFGYQIHLYWLWHTNRRYDIVNSCKVIATHLKQSDVVFGETNFIWEARCRFLPLINTNLNIPNASFILKNPFKDKEVTHLMLKVPPNLITSNYLEEQIRPNVKELLLLCEVGVRNIKYRLYKVVY